MKTRTTYRFDDFWLNPATHELLRGEQEVSLTPKAFGCLTYLIENRDRAIGRDEMISAVWGRVDCADSVVKRVIFDLRQALNDSGDNSHYVKSVRGIGYRWVAPVDEETVEVPNGNDGSFWRHHAFRRWLAPAVIGMIVVLALGATWLWRTGDPDLTEHSTFVPAEGEIALLLPVDVEPGPNGDHSWIRLGLMDMIAERLRAAGQAMVPSEDVLVLLQGAYEGFSHQELSRLGAVTGARLLLSASAENEDGLWRVSLQGFNDEGEGDVVLGAFAESESVLDAARMAADRIALSLGLTPAPAPDDEPGLALLLQQTEAALLAQQSDLARELIEAADPELADQPDIRLRLGRIEFNHGQLGVAEAIFESLLAEPAVTQNSELHVRVLNALAGVQYRRGEYIPAKQTLEEADRAIGADGSAFAIAPQIQMSLGLIMLMLGGLDEAERHFARARQLLEGTGNLSLLATWSGRVGLLEARRERYSEALFYFKQAAGIHATLHDLSGELINLSNAALTALFQLELETAALLVMSRLEELRGHITDPGALAHANLARAVVLDAIGESQEAKHVLEEVLSATDARGNALPGTRLSGLILTAERALRHGDYDQAMRLALDVIEQVSLDPGRIREQSRTWLILVRAQAGQGNLAAAAETAAEMADWSAQLDAPTPRVYAALAAAEVVAAEGSNSRASAAYEWALRLATEGRIPQVTLWVVKSYVSWLLTRGPLEAQDVEQVALVANRIIRYTDQDFGAALVWLRIHHATGPAAAWRTALERAQSLSGEREIPPELLIPPGRQQHQTTSLGTSISEDSGPELP